MFVIERNEPLLGNYRVKRSVYIVDRLFEGGQLRGGPKTAVSIRHMRASLPAPANRGHAAGPGHLGGAGGGGAGKGFSGLGTPLPTAGEGGKVDGASRSR
jgi:hypothetical protein